MNEAAATLADTKLTDEHRAITQELITNWETRYGNAQAEDVHALITLAQGFDEYVHDALKVAAKEVAEAEENLAAARANLTRRIRVAHLARIPETKIAAETGAARLTVRRALGK